MLKYYCFKSKGFAAVSWPNTNLALGQFCLTKPEFLLDTMQLFAVLNCCVVLFIALQN